jgi:hypothetical protein
MATKKDLDYLVQDLQARFSTANGITLDPIVGPDRGYESHVLVPHLEIIPFIVDITNAPSFHASKDVRIAVYIFDDKDDEITPILRQWFFVMEVCFDVTDHKATHYAQGALCGALSSMLVYQHA